jgi:hypothetical protein
MRTASRIAITATAWVAFALAVNLLRFGRVPGSAREVAGGLLGFALLGAIAGWRLSVLLDRSGDSRRRTGAVVGHVIAAPLGYLLGVAAPLALEVAGPIPATVQYLVVFPLLIGIVGSLPVLGGQYLGWRATAR